MKRHDHYYASNSSKNCGKYVMLAMLAIFFISISAFAIVEIRNFYTDESIVQKILMNSFKTSTAMPETSQPEFVFIETNENSERLPRALALEQNSTISPANTTQKPNYYYEEQKPVVVYSKTDMVSPIAYKQLKEVPPKQDTDDDDADPYRKPLADDEDYDYFGQPSSSSYYRQPPYQSAPDSYYRSQPNANNYYRSPPPSYPQYFDDSREDFPGPQQKEQMGSEEARNSQYSDYNNNNNYYRQWHYATPPPPAPAMSTAGSTSPNGRLAPTRSGQENRKGQEQQQQQQQRQPPNRDPYAAYMDDYDDMPPQSHKPQPYPFAQYRKSPQQLHRYQQQQQQQIAQYRTPSSSAIQAEEKEVERRPQMDVLTVIKSLKSMWDLYQSFSSSWNTIAERRNREEELEQQKLKQLQQIRVNSKKPPPKFNNKRNQTSNGNNKNSKKQSTTTTTSTSTTLAPAIESLERLGSSEEEEMVAKVKKQPPAKVEPRKALKGDKTSAKNAEGLRDKRQAAMETTSTDVGEGRYIKGDPLKGYYDFVITEGSYKFWAAFQVGTALLIIYSTFAAIYYSKVNPLVSDYDYTDYLGGARSLSGGDLDFVDDDDATAVAGQKSQPKSWLEWLPRSGHSLKFILDAIDKLPVDHAEENIKDQEQEASESNTDYVNSNGMAAERQENPEHVDVDNIDYTAEEGSGGGDDVDQITENRDNVKVIRDTNESTEEDVNVDHTKAM